VEPGVEVETMRVLRIWARCIASKQNRTGTIERPGLLFPQTTATLSHNTDNYRLCTGSGE